MIGSTQLHTDIRLSTEFFIAASYRIQAATGIQQCTSSKAAKAIAGNQPLEEPLSSPVDCTDTAQKPVTEESPPSESRALTTSQLAYESSCGPSAHGRLRGCRRAGDASGASGRTVTRSLARSRLRVHPCRLGRRSESESDSDPGRVTAWPGRRGLRASDRYADGHGAAWPGPGPGCPVPSGPESRNHHRDDRAEPSESLSNCDPS